MIIDCLKSANEKTLKKLLRSISIINIAAAVSLFGGQLVRLPWPLQDIVQNTPKFFSDSLIDATGAFYCIVLHILLVHQKEIIRKISPNIQSVRDSRRMICLMVERFERKLSYLPFVWFLNGIVSTSYFTMRTTSSESLHEIVTSVSWIITSVTPPVIVCIVVSKIEESIARGIDACHDRISHSVRMTASESLLLKTELDSIKQTAMRVTGLSFFTLNRSLAISYLGNLITFVALIGTYIKNI